MKGYSWKLNRPARALPSLLLGITVFAAMMGIFAGLNGCRLRPGSTTIDIPPSRLEREHGRLLVVRSPDPVAGRILCESLATSGLFSAIYCLPESDIRGDYEIDIVAEIRESSTDFVRNAGLSLLTLTTMLRLTTSGTTEFHFHTLTSGGISRHHVLRGKGRIGSWLILPLYAGLIGTSLGSVINDYREPQRLQSRCLGNRRAGRIRPGSDACREYKEYLRDSFSRVRENLGDIIWRELSIRPSPGGILKGGIQI